MFGSNNLIKEPDGLIFENYTKSDSKLDQHVKSFVRPREIVNAHNPHFYNIRNKLKMYGLDNRIVTGVEAFHKIDIKYCEAPAYIAHYVNQSEETYKRRKVLLPRDDTGTQRNAGEIKKIHDQHNDYDNLQPMTKYAATIKQFLAFYNR